MIKVLFNLFILSGFLVSLTVYPENIEQNTISKNHSKRAVAFNDPFIPFLESVPSVKDTIKVESEGSGNSAITIESFTFSSRNDTNTVYGILAYPQQAGTYPGILTLHGGGSYAEQLRNEVKNFAKAGYVSMAIDVPGICATDKPETAHSTGPWKSRPGEGPRFEVADGPGHSTLADGIIAGLEAFNFLSAHEKTDASKMGVTGYSWGGYVTTMLSGVLKERVHAAWAVFGCGFFDRGSFWSESIAALPADVRATWLEFLDAGRRAPHIKAAYFIDAPTNDVFFWPVAVQATLDAITAPKNHVWGANLFHQNMGMGARDRFFTYHLKGAGSPLAKAVITKEEAVDSGKRLTVEIDIPSGVSIAKVTLCQSIPNTIWADRQWTSLPAQKVNDSTYTAELSSELINNKVDFYVLVKDNKNAFVATDMHCGGLIRTGVQSNKTNRSIDRFNLNQNYPNPFNPTTIIRYNLEDVSDVTLAVYNMRGRLVKTLVNSRQPAGRYDIQWNADNDFGARMASGLYFYKLDARSGTKRFVETRKMVLMK